jgi:DNA-binding MarR family transcriptional regulator
MSKDISQISTYESGVMQSTAHRILGRINADFLSNYGLTPTQWFIIGLTYDAGSEGIRLGTLKEMLDTTMPFITTSVNHLESKGILQKLSHTDDSRVKIAKLNPQYAATVKKIEAGLREELRTQLYAQGDINREELAAYISVLYKIARANKSS